MKKTYEKPLIAVEALSLDRPIAAGTCTADIDDMKSVIELGYFTAEKNCLYPVVGDGALPGYDTICYHGNVQTAFTS